jgi:hypothetical protein
MFEGGFRQMLHRQVDAITLPPEDTWVPRVASSAIGPWVLVSGLVAIAFVVGVVAIGGVRLPEIPAAQEPARVTPPARPTTIDGHTDIPLPNAYRNTQFNYNLVLPAWFHETRYPGGAPPNTPLLQQKVFTARDDADEARLASSVNSRGGLVLPWDLVVEVYQRGGRSLEEWAGMLGCDRSGPVGTSTCALTTTRVHGTDALVGTRSSPSAGKIYLIERGDQVLVLRYVLGDESDRPADVSEATLEQIIASLGLV